MKKKFLLFNLIFMMSYFTGRTQTNFEDLLLPNPPMGAYWNGSDLSNGFTSGDVYFPNRFDTSFGGFWASGFAYSSMLDTVTSGYQNMYSAKAFGGSQGSAQYGVAQNMAVLKLTGLAAGGTLDGLYITNTTYAYNSMRDGDMFARKFGDTTGTGSGLPQGTYPDWFKLTIKAYLSGVLKNDSVEFYLADFRFSDPAQDYIVNTWQMVNTPLGYCDSVLFILSSSDNGAFGMNTPAFFCLDDLSVQGPLNNRNLQEKEILSKQYDNHVYILNFRSAKNRKTFLYNVNGQLIESSETNENLCRIDLQKQNPGIYYLNVIENDQSFVVKLLNP